jgi:hypothetical protein
MASKQTIRRALQRARAERHRYREDRGRQVLDHPLVLPAKAGRKLPENPTRDNVAAFFASEIDWLNRTRRR